MESSDKIAWHVMFCFQEYSGYNVFTTCLAYSIYYIFFVQIRYKHHLVSCLGHLAGGGVTVAPVAEQVVAVYVHPGRECENHTKA